MTEESAHTKIMHVRTWPKGNLNLTLVDQVTARLVKEFMHIFLAGLLGEMGIYMRCVVCLGGTCI